MLDAKNAQVTIEHAHLDQACDNELNQILCMGIDLLFHDRELLDDRPSRPNPAEPKAGREHLGEAVDPNHDQALLIQCMQGGRRRRGSERKLAVRFVLDDWHPEPTGEFDQLAARADRNGDPVGF